MNLMEGFKEKQGMSTVNAVIYFIFVLKYLHMQKSCKNILHESFGSLSIKQSILQIIRKYFNTIYFTPKILTKN